MLMSRESTDILEELRQLSQMIVKNEQLFNMATEDEVIEAVIYEQRALQSRYAYLLKRAREKGIRIDYTDRL